LRGERVILALDVEKKKALSLAREASEFIKTVKVGLELFCTGGKEIVREINEIGLNVFLDLKFHDIPRQVERAVRAFSDLPIKMLTLHTLGGRKMLQRAVEASKNLSPKPILLGVTILTSLEEKDLKVFCEEVFLKESVLRLAEMALESGLDGVVASPLEVELLRSKLGRDFMIVTPGVRLRRKKAGDQVRVLHPKEALVRGADYVVVGREVTESVDPISALKEVLSQVN
jgi:orotidine-5'-phosphate decarboxylase